MNHKLIIIIDKDTLGHFKVSIYLYPNAILGNKTLHNFFLG